jgi:hypothetical protein
LLIKEGGFNVRRGEERVKYTVGNRESKTNNAHHEKGEQ